jgi:hypothetical protein
MVALSIHNPQSYQEQIHNFVYKSYQSNLAFSLRQNKIPLFNFGLDQIRLAKVLAHSVLHGTYQLSPPKKRSIVRKNKQRAVYEYELTDKIVLKVFAQYLNTLYKPFIAKQLYSYQKGKNAGKAIQELSKYIKTYRKRLAINGLYFLKIDIKSYSDSIIIGKNSTLWPRLDELLQGSFLQQHTLDLIREMIRPAYRNEDGLIQVNNVGVPTGSPISNFLYNFYCAPIDSAFSNLPDLFYARFGDDILLAHPNPDALSDIKKSLFAEISKLSLTIHQEKVVQCYLSPAGNQGAAFDYPGKNAFDYLGYRIDGYGNVTLSEKRKRQFLRAMFRRIKHSHALLKDKSIDEENKIMILCQTVNNAFLDPEFLQGEVKSIISETNDQGQLKHLDYLIALNIATRVTNIQGVRAFSKLPYKMLRTNYGLCSLINMRNGKK